MLRFKTNGPGRSKTGKGSPGASVRWQRVLIKAAVRARAFAAARYSNFKVGAALLTPSGQIIAGANVESASYGLTCCAERVALFKALTQGEREFVAIAVVARAQGGPMPCGACRQLLAEYAPGLQVLSADTKAPREFRVYDIGQLLPAPFLDVPVASSEGSKGL